MLFKYSTTSPTQNEFDSLPRIPLLLQRGDRSIEAVGLVDSGATVNVLPYELGIHLGAEWDEQKAIIQLSGNLGNVRIQVEKPPALRRSWYRFQLK